MTAARRGLNSHPVKATLLDIRTVLRPADAAPVRATCGAIVLHALILVAYTFKSTPIVTALFG